MAAKGETPDSYNLNRISGEHLASEDDVFMVKY